MTSAIRARTVVSSLALGAAMTISATALSLPANAQAAGNTMPMSAAGKIVKLDTSAKTITLDNNNVYTVEADLQMKDLKVGQDVTFELMPNNGNQVSKIVLSTNPARPIQ